MNVAEQKRRHSGLIAFGWALFLFSLAVFMVLFYNTVKERWPEYASVSMRAGEDVVASRSAVEPASARLSPQPQATKPQPEKPKPNNAAAPAAVRDTDRNRVENNPPRISPGPAKPPADIEKPAGPASREVTPPAPGEADKQPEEVRSVPVDVLPGSETTQAEYTIVYDAQGGKISGPVSKKVKHGSKYGDLPGAERPGYSFEGWWTAPESGGAKIVPDAVLALNRDHTVYARWAMFSISYRGNNHSAGSPPDTWLIEKRESVRIAAHGTLRGPIIRDGVTQRFISWNTLPDGTGLEYNAGGRYPLPDANLTLYAQWTKDEDLIGKIGPGGGHLFYDKGSRAGGWRYMESAPKETEWVIAPYLVPGRQLEAGAASATEIGMGAANTLTIRAAAGAASAGGEKSAAELCLGLLQGGMSDWFLPSKDELNLVYKNLYAANPSLGGFAPRSYWSSSRHETGLGWFQYFESGRHATILVTSLARVRAVRTF